VPTRAIACPQIPNSRKSPLCCSCGRARGQCCSACMCRDYTYKLTLLIIPTCFSDSEMNNFETTTRMSGTQTSVTRMSVIDGWDNCDSDITMLNCALV
jgi:hypothetical protein